MALKELDKSIGDSYDLEIECNPKACERNRTPSITPQ